MDRHRFDDLTRLLASAGTRRAGLRAALGAIGLLGLGDIAATPDADARRTDRDRRNGPAAARKRKHECGPDAPCPAGYDCLKQGRKRRCSCSTGVTCDGACCPTGQVCQDGACVTVEACVPPGEPCKGVGRPCCDGRVCSSGQGGEADVACYVPKTGRCETTADCAYLTFCVNGRCALDVPPPAPLAEPCDPSLGQQCDVPGATCSAYDGAGAPGGSFCTLPLNYACTGDRDCTCYHCGWVSGDDDAGAGSRRAARAASGPRLACCGPAGFACASDRNCCLGNVCANGTCGPETTCDVCKSGACPYLTVAAAVAAMPAGSTIRVAPDTYQVDAPIAVGKSLTIRPCGAASGVVMETAGFAVFDMYPDAGDFRLEVIGIEFRQGGISTFGTEAGRATLQVGNCAFLGADPGIGVGNHVDITVNGSRFDGLGTANSLVRVGKYALGGSTFAATGCDFKGSVESAIFLGNVATTLTDCTVVGGGGYTFNQLVVGGAIFFLAQGTTVPDGPPNRMTLTLAGSTTVSGASATNAGGGVAVVSAEGAVASLAMTGSSRIQGNAITGPGTPTPDGSGLVYFITNTNANVFGSGVAGRVSGNVGGANQCATYVYGDGGTDPGYFIPLATCEPAPFCLGNANFCSATSNACCAGNSCSAVTPLSGFTSSRCCLAAAAACTTDQTCCDISGTRATCQGGTCQVCLAQGASCSAAIDCCSGDCQGTCQ